MPPTLLLSKEMRHIFKNNSSRCLRCHQPMVPQVNELPGQHKDVIKSLQHNNHLEDFEQCSQDFNNKFCTQFNTVQ
eukprot:3490548-Prorocentrum_lima.AAC.1